MLIGQRDRTRVRAGKVGANLATLNRPCAVVRHFVRCSKLLEGLSVPPRSRPLGRSILNIDEARGIPSCTRSGMPRTPVYRLCSPSGIEERTKRVPAGPRDECFGRGGG